MDNAAETKTICPICGKFNKGACDKYSEMSAKLSGGKVYDENEYGQCIDGYWVEHKKAKVKMTPEGLRDLPLPDKSGSI